MRSVLPTAEWFAENAYVAPGAHRLMTATGLMGGLVSGRYLMNVLTAQTSTGHPTTKEDVLSPLQPLHGLYRYQRFDNSPSARWHQVVYDVAPIALGGIGAVIGSTRFSATTRFAEALRADVAAGQFGLQQACMLASKVQARAYNRISGFNFGIGSSSGFHLFPTPISTATNAVRFQMENGKKPMLGIAKSLFGHRGPRSRDLFSSVIDLKEWATHNAANHAGSRWYQHYPKMNEYAQALLQNALEYTPEQFAQTQQWISGIGKRLNQRAQEIRTMHPGIAPDALVGMLRKDSVFATTLKEFSDVEGHYVRLGIIDPAHPERANLALGDHGVLSTVAKWLGAGKDMEEVKQTWHQAIKFRYGHATEAALPSQQLMSYRDFTPRVLAASSAMLAGGAALVATGSREPKPTLSAQEKNSLRHLPRHEADARYHVLLSKQTGSGVAHFVNGSPLNVAEWTASVASAAPNLHRFLNAASLSAFLYTGAKFSCALAGRGLRGELLTESAVWPIFKPFYGKLSYAYKSGLPMERLKWAIHQLIPVSVGAVGTYMGSHLYFGDKERSLRQPKTLEDTTEAILMHESESYSKASAFSSILNTGSGLHLMPIFSYSGNLNNRFLMAHGHQVCTPLLGQWWSGNHSLYPEHVKALLMRLEDCTVQSPDEYPAEYRPMVEALLSKLYPALAFTELDQKTNAMLDALYKVRDSFWQEGGVPEQQHAACRAAFKAAFRAQGLEDTLRTIGLEPLDAALDNNGVSGSIARWLGAGAQVKYDIESYHRHVRQQHASAPPTAQISEAQQNGKLQPPVAALQCT